MATDGEVAAFALRRVAEEVEANQPKMAVRMRELAKLSPVALTREERAFLISLVKASTIEPPDDVVPEPLLLKLRQD